MKPAVVSFAAGLLAAMLLLVASPARAGGDFVDLAAGSGRVWFVGEPGVRELDARTGRLLASPHLVGAAYPLSVALAGGAVWIASVENGYVEGTLTRIDERTGKRRVLWRKQNHSVQYVAAGAGGVWALIGSTTAPNRSRIARFTLAGRLSRSWSIPDAGRIAADASGCWISTNQRLLHIDPNGHIHQVLRASLGDVTTGAGAVWLPQGKSILRIDERTGRARTLHTGRLRLGGFQHDLAAGDGALWALSNGGAHATLLRIDQPSGRRTGHIDIPGIADVLIVKPRAIWVATVIVPTNRTATGYEVIRIDPRTLRKTVLAHID
jgi:hypothetical protein